MKAYKNLIKGMIDNQEETLNMYNDIREELRIRKCVFEGEPFKIALVPMILKKKDSDLLGSVSEILYRIINKIIKASDHDKNMAPYFSYKDIPEEWLSVDKGYKDHAVITRLDALYDGKNLKFLEFNTDNPGGKGWNDIFEEIVLYHPAYRELFPSGMSLHKKSVVHGLFKAVMKSSSDFWGPGEKTSVAIIDYRESQFLGDGEIVKDYFLSKNIHAELMDPRDLYYINDRLKYKGTVYNTVIRCVKSQEFLEHPKELEGFISAYMKGHVCMVNSFKSLLGSEKSMLAMLCKMSFHHYFTEKEKDVIRNYIPWTFTLGDRSVFTREGKEMETKSYLIKNQENFVIKPSWGYGGKGVILGKHMSSDKWQEAVYKYGGETAWIAQEYVEIPKIEIPVINNGHVEIGSKYFNLSPYVFGGKYVGCLGRISDLPVINVSAGGGIIPVMKEEESEQKR